MSKRNADIPWYFVCENCNCKFFNDVSPCGCPRCGETLASTERIQPPWKVQLFTVKDAATRLNCSQATVYNLIATGKLAHHRCPGVRISEEQLAAYLDETRCERRTEPTPVRSPPPRRLKHIKL